MIINYFISVICISDEEFPSLRKNFRRIVFTISETAPNMAAMPNMTKGIEAVSNGYNNVVRPATRIRSGITYIKKDTRSLLLNNEIICISPISISTPPSTNIKMATKKLGDKNIHKPSSRLPNATKDIIFTLDETAPKRFNDGTKVNAKMNNDGKINNAPTHITMKGIACSRNISSRMPMVMVDMARTNRFNIFTIAIQLNNNPTMFKDCYTRLQRY